jgi:L-seryl-tRNA(Ser) seleniumtransferase
MLDRTGRPPVAGAPAKLKSLPSVDRLLKLDAISPLLGAYGHTRVVEMLRQVLDSARSAMRADSGKPTPDNGAIVEDCGRRLWEDAKPAMRAVFNLTGTVLHTNLGRALLPEEAIAAVAEAMRMPANLEYSLQTGARGDRDDLVEALLKELTGAEACTIVNNNAAAVFLTLNTLAMRKEVIVSRGELVEIGGSFRIPDIMSRAGAKLREVGTTNRTHPADFEEAIGPRTAMLMKVHWSNYAISGFTAAVPEKSLAELAHRHGLPFVNDLGCGSLIDLSAHGLPKEPTASAAIADGADLVLFSGDKLLGGPQAGIIVGHADLVRKIKKNPLKRALRVGKITLAALEAVLRLYRHPEQLPQRLTTLRLLTRPAQDIIAAAQRLCPHLVEAVGEAYHVELVALHSQIGSGSLPVDLLPSAGLAIRPAEKRRGAGTALRRLEEALRALPVPIIGHVRDGALILDFRCLEDETRFLAQLDELGELLR